MRFLFFIIANVQEWGIRLARCQNHIWLIWILVKFKVWMISRIFMYSSIQPLGHRFSYLSIKCGQVGLFLIFFWIICFPRSIYFLWTVKSNKSIQILECLEKLIYPSSRILKWVQETSSQPHIRLWGIRAVCVCFTCCIFQTTRSSLNPFCLQKNCIMLGLA